MLVCSFIVFLAKSQRRTIYNYKLLTILVIPVLIKGLLKLIAHNPEQEEASDEMQVEYSGQEVEIGFNVSYLLDALRVLNSEVIELRLKDQNSSCTLNAPADKETRYLVMPMRI